MWGPDGWENNLPVFSYLAKYTDSQDVVINVDKRIGGTWEELGDYAWKLADPLGRVPAHSRTGTKRIDVNYGKKSKRFFDMYNKYSNTVQFLLQLILNDLCSNTYQVNAFRVCVSHNFELVVLTVSNFQHWGLKPISCY